MAQWLIVLPALREDSNLVSYTHFRWLRPYHFSCSINSMLSMRILSHMAHAHTDTQTHKYNITSCNMLTLLYIELLDIIRIPITYFH